MEFTEMIIPLTFMIFLIAMGMLICITLSLLFFNDIFLDHDKDSQAEWSGHPRTRMQLVRTRTRGHGGRRSAARSSSHRVSRETQLMRMPNRTECSSRARKAEGYELPFTRGPDHSPSRVIDTRGYYADVGWVGDKKGVFVSKEVMEFRERLYCSREERQRCSVEEFRWYQKVHVDTLRY
ncbi:hypothetical protein F5Y08DRAFT_335773 [Xylaria arbuscula]|nr:hypothetical protein F5Y08DRAFT_335773 [Xylaria arbuscula]